jgi:hypothetical protein
LDDFYEIGDMDTLRQTKDVLDLTEKIHSISEQGKEMTREGIRGTGVEIKTKNGRVLKETVLLSKDDS